MRARMRVLALAVLDAVAVNAAYFGALWLRFDGRIPGVYLETMVAAAPWVTVVSLGAYWVAGMYRSLWEYASVREMFGLARGVTLASVCAVAILYGVLYPGVSLRPLPRSVFVLAWSGGVALSGVVRLALRVSREHRAAAVSARCVAAASTSTAAAVRPYGACSLGRGPGARRRVLIVGAGDAGAMVLRELRAHAELGLEPVGFVDDDPRKVGLELHGLRVLGRREDIPALVRDKKVDRIIIAMPSAPGSSRREVFRISSATGAEVLTVPGVYELVGGRISLGQVREVRVEDLLGREPVQVDLGEIAGYLAGRTVLVTGAGGSIGSELCRQVARFNPSCLILLEYSENNLFEIERELASAYLSLQLVPELGDVRDKPAVERLFWRHRPDVVFHAAAYKHVSLSERWPEKAFANNVFGTYVVASAAHRVGSGVFVLISSDKAVNPAGVMGATKRAAELVVQVLSGASDTRFAAVRFGNVLGSNGSVVNIFRRQIAAGGPVTVTHPEMERYFMTVPEAVQLVIQAGAYARGGEVFVLDMGERVRIVDLAEEMIRLSGLEPYRDVEIRFVGVRPGEKLREELFYAYEKPAATRHPRILVVANHRSPGTNLVDLSVFERSDGWRSGDKAVDLLRQMVPEWKAQDAAGCEVVAWEGRPSG